MPVFSPAYNAGLLFGVAAGTAISIWWYNRPSIYERVKQDVERENSAKKH
jgi:hypothetical protein